MNIFIQDIKEYGLFATIKYAYQRVIRGYDERVYWEFSSYFLQVIPALKNFCEKELKNAEHMVLNPKEKEIFTETLRLIKELEIAPFDDWYKHPNAESRLLSYVGEHIGWYWN